MRLAFADMIARDAPDADASRRRRRLVDHALHIGHDIEARRVCHGGIAAERAAAIAHVAQNLYGRGERTLGVMPLYHTMGVRSLLAMSLIGGTFICLPRYDSRQALALIETRADHATSTWCRRSTTTSSYRGVRRPDVSSVRKLGFAGASMTDGLLKRLDAAFRPELFVNHYGSSEIYTFTIDQNAPAKPGSAGKAGINQHIRVVRIGARSVGGACRSRRRGRDHRIACRRRGIRGLLAAPEADAKALREGWYFTGDTGYCRSPMAISSSPAASTT